MGLTVLVVEDEQKICDLVRRYLERDGFGVLSTGSGAEAMRLLEESDIDLVVLDLNLPDVSGESIASEWHGRVPILMLTAKSTEWDRIAGLELGADDYMVKPFSPRELVLRVHAVLRRAGHHQAPVATLSFGGGQLVIDTRRHEVTVRGAHAELTSTEWALLTALAASPGRVFSRAELVNRVRGYEFDGYERTIDSHVKNLRRKIEADPHNPTIVETVAGAGYRLGLLRDEAH